MELMEGKHQGKRGRAVRGAVVLLALLCALLLVSCGGAGGATQSAKPEQSLDLSNSGLSDVTDLLKRTDLDRLNLSGNPISTEQYDALAAALPDCEILWSVPVGAERIDSDATSAEIPFNADALNSALPYLAQLSDLTLTGTTAADYPALLSFASAHPALSVRWDVQIGASSYPSDTASLDLTGVETEAGTLQTALAGFQKLSEVRLDPAVVLTREEQNVLQAAYPDVTFDWSVTLLDGFSVASDAESIDLRGYEVPDAAAFGDALALLPKLTYADMCGCGLSNDEMVALRERYPAVKFVWLIRVAGWEIRTDIKGFSTGQRNKFPDGAGEFVAAKHSYRSYHSKDFENLTLCTDLIALDVGHCTNIGDVDFIARLPKLKYLIISLCDITDISPLAGQTELEFLEIKYNYIADLSPLAGCTKIRFLNCANNEISDFSVVKNMPNLERLWINMNNFTRREADELAASLPNVTLKASLDNREYAESLWRKDNQGYLAMQALFGLRAQNQGKKTP